MIKLKRALGRLIYVFLALPALIGGMTLMSVRPWVLSPDRYKALVEDRRFAAVLESPKLPDTMPETITVSGIRFNGPALVSAMQESLGSADVSRMLTSGIDRFFQSIRDGKAELMLDLAPIKTAIGSNAGQFAQSYLRLAAAQAASETQPNATPSAETQAAAKAAIDASSLSPELLTKAIQEGIQSLPDILRPTPQDTPDETNAVASTQGKAVQSANALERIDLEQIQQGMGPGALSLLLVGLGLAVASACISETELRKRLGSLGARLIPPGAVFAVLGIVPMLFNPARAAGKEASRLITSFPALAEYAHFVARSLSGNFLWVGLAVLGLGFLMSTVHHAIPPSEDIEDLEEGQEL